MATLRGEGVDRPPVNFYEIGGLTADPSDPDEFNVYSDPSWLPLLQLAEQETDVIRMRGAHGIRSGDNPRDEFFRVETYTEGGLRFTRRRLDVAGRTMTALERRDPDVNTAWCVEHLLKDVDDLKAYLQLPPEVFDYEPDVGPLEAADRDVGEKGIVMVDTSDPLCRAAELFPMSDYLIVAMTERKLFHRLLAKIAGPLYEFTEKVARDFPGHLWRICGPEYAGVPYLPPELFSQYVVEYDTPMVRSIQKYGGYARVHMHGHIRSSLPMIAEMSPDALDPIEPPPQGDVELWEVRERYGADMVLFGNLEACDIQNAAPDEFEALVAKALREGTAGQGRGFVLTPSACPCGRNITSQTMTNYETMVRLAKSFAG